MASPSPMAKFVQAARQQQSAPSTSSTRPATQRASNEVEDSLVPDLQKKNPTETKPKPFGGTVTKNDDAEKETPTSREDIQAMFSRGRLGIEEPMPAPGSVSTDVRTQTRAFYDQGQEEKKERLNAPIEATPSGLTGLAKWVQEDSRRPEIVQLSQEEYAALDPRARAAVDLNGDLLKAVELDRASDLFEAGSTDQGYQDQVNALFGKTGGSDRYAPNTVALLSSLGVGSLHGDDLDRYISGQSLINTDELGLIGDASINSLVDARANNVNRLASSAASRLSETLAAGQSLLDSVTETPLTVGYGMSDLDNQLARFYELSSNKNSGFDEKYFNETLGFLEQQYNVAPSDVQDYFERRLRQQDYSSALNGVDENLLTPDEFRARWLSRG